MSLEQADLLEAYLLDQPGVKSAAVHERTCCATVCYTGSRAELLHAIGPEIPVTSSLPRW